ncbi:MAG: ABC transporter permease [Flavisolibacter sp.]
MFRNYLKVAARNLWKNKGFSAINIFGLAIGLACFLLIFLYVMNELSYDRYNKNAGRIYRVHSEINFGGNMLNLAVTSDPMGATLKKDYPQVEEFTRLYASGFWLFRKGNEFIRENHVIYADSTVFKVFTLPFVAGDPNTALTEPKTLVISASAAKKYFGSTDVIGKTMESDDHVLHKITGVIKDIPEESHFHADFIYPMKDAQYSFGNFLSHNHWTYILLRPGTNPKEFEKNFKTIVQKYVFPQAQEMMKVPSVEEFEKSGNKVEYKLMPLTDIHLHSDLTAEIGVNGNAQFVYIFGAVALFLLVIACINFMNLSTARSANRAQEVGIRKVLGTQRKNLIFQFLTESTLMAILSLLLAIGIAYLVLPFFNNIASKSLSFGSFFKPSFLVPLIFLPFVVGLLAGSYPAFYLSSFRPIQVLKGKLSMGSAGGNIRSSLVVFQFFISIVLITATIIVYKQLDYIQSRQLGFNKNQVLVLNETWSLDKNVDAFKNEMMKVPGVQSITVSGFLPVNSSRNDNTFYPKPVFDSKEALSMQIWTVDYDYIKTLGMQMVKGRAFSRDFGTDSSGIIINEVAAKYLGFTDPIGKKLYTYDDMQAKTLSQFTIIGVVKNFNYESLRQNIGPLGMKLGNHAGNISMKVDAAHIPSILSEANSKWKSMTAGIPMNYQFLDDAFDQMYRNEQRVGKIALIFSILTIFIACLGLFGLATFIAEQRTKEIGIRKVLGASVSNIVTMLSKDFVKLVLIAAIIAIPIAWWGISKWLQDFAFRVHLSWWVFVIAGIGAIAIALATISFQAIRAAVTNPVKNLRTE